MVTTMKTTLTNDNAHGQVGEVGKTNSIEHTDSNSGYDLFPETVSQVVQFHAPVRFENIRGHFRFSFQLEAPSIVWGKNGHCWAFLHDFDARSIRLILDDCRQATYDRRGCSSNPFEGR